MAGNGTIAANRGTERSPFSFLTALDGGDALHRRILNSTREAEMEIATHMIAASKVSLIYAYSGNGKSSFINAGLIPFFVNQGYAVFRSRPRPPIETKSPSEAFKACVLAECFLPEMTTEQFEHLQELKQELKDMGDVKSGRLLEILARIEPYIRPTEPANAKKEQFRELLKQHLELDMYEFVGEIQKLLGGSTRLLFICDQFEELFVHFSNSSQMQAFVSSVGKICRDQRLKAQFLFSMREDWVGSMIEFRKEVPDIFASYFKLAPLRKGQAPAAVTIPLADRNIEVSPDLLERVLSDLSALYDQQQLLEFSPVKLVPSDKKDPYLELPALQVIAEELWRTRGLVDAPFTIAHYDWLGKRFGNGNLEGKSPAEIILSDYLQDFLEMPESMDKPSSGLHPSDVREARLDILYLLTDRRAHRRALTEDEIRRALTELRPKILELPPISGEQIHALLSPLVEAKLVRTEITRTGEIQYELAHDFAVREVVRSWLALELRRDREIAFREKIEKEISRRRLAVLFKQELIVRLVMFAGGLLLGITSMLKFAPAAWSFVIAAIPSIPAVEIGAAACVVAMGLAGRLRAWGLLGLVGLASLPWADCPAIKDVVADFLTYPTISGGFTAHLWCAAIPASLAVACLLQLLGLMLSPSKEKAKARLYLLAVEFYEMTLLQCGVGLVLLVILLFEVFKIHVIPPGPLWWLVLFFACALVYGFLSIITVRFAAATPGSWLGGFQWTPAKSGAFRIILWSFIAVALGVINDLSVVGGLAISMLIGTMLGSGSVSAAVLQTTLLPCAETAALEKPEPTPDDALRTRLAEESS